MLYPRDVACVLPSLTLTTMADITHRLHYSLPSGSGEASESFLTQPGMTLAVGGTEKGLESRTIYEVESARCKENGGLCV